MSQYPSPYSPPPGPYSQGGYGYGWNPYDQYLAPARRAGVLMIILGALAMTCGTCALGFSYTPTDQLPAEQQEAFRQMEEQVGMSLMTYMRWAGAGLMVPGVAFVLIGVWVRRGTRAAIVTAMVAAGLAVLYFALGSVLMLVRGAGIQACFQLVLVAPFGLLIVWLAQAWRYAGALGASQSQYQAQYWQYLQQQQQYGQQYPAGGYAPPPGQPPIAPGGSPLPPPPPPPPPPEGGTDRPQP